MKDKIKKTILDSWPLQDFDHLAMATFSLKDGSYELYEFHEGQEKSISNFYFDLASLTKPLTMGALAAHRPELFYGERLLMLEHRAGFPAWAILGHSNWRESVESFEVVESSGHYSDLSMLRLMLTIEKDLGISIEELSNFYWDRELCFWKDLPKGSLCGDTGFRNSSPINSVVNDDNCFKINSFCSHAGLFSTISGLTKSLISLEETLQLTSFMKTKIVANGSNNRFIWGWDTVSDNKKTLAGAGAPKNTFGHLGFTGTSIWIDADSGVGWTLLTNATKKYWHNREELNKLRRKLGAIVWEVR